jgi:hypothetical protein
MKLVCIKVTNFYYRRKDIIELNGLTLGKVYSTIFTVSIDEYYVSNDDGFMHYYPKHWFITLQESRRLKLKKLGI